MKKRTIIYLIRLAVVIIGAVVIWALGRGLLNRIQDLQARNQARGLYAEHSPIFSTAATAIQQDNSRISFDLTHMPSATPTPTEDTGNQVTLTPTLPSTAAETSPATLAATTEVPSTQIPATSATTEVPTSLATSPDTIAAPTGQPNTVSAPSATDTTIPTAQPPATKAPLIATLPPTNTKRPTVVVPTATPTIAATDVPAITSTPTATLTATVVVAAVVPTTAPTIAPTTASTIAPTSKLPTVVLPAKRTEKPQVTAIPTNAPRVKANGSDIMNILLIGSDQDVDPTDPSFRTDSMVIVSINRTANTVSMLSVPRDLFVYIPTLGMQRINTAFQWGQAIGWTPGGGFGLLQATILYNLGIPIHYYAKVSLIGFKKIVDSVNGIDLAVDCPISDLRFQGKVDDKKTPVYEPYTLNPGFYHMDGSLTLWYARMRHSTSDFDRSRRQQQVLRAIWHTARDQGLITKAPELWNTLTGIVETNMQLPDVLGLVPLALSLKPGDISSFYMNKGYELQHWKTPAGDDVQLPDPQGFFKTINDFYTPRTGNRFGAQAATVEIVNGAQTKDWDKIAADRLAWEGFEVQDKGAGDASGKTIVYDLTGNAKPGALQAMLKALNVKPNQVISQPDPNRTTDFRLVLGDDYNSCTAPGFAK